MRLRFVIPIVAALLLGADVSLLFAAPQNEPAPNQNQDQQNQDQNKPPDVVAQPQSPAPAPSPEAATPQSQPPAPAQAPAASTPESKSSAATIAKKAHTRKKRKIVAKTPVTQSGKVVVRNGGSSTASAQLSPGISQEQARHQQENTDQLLATTDANLKRVAGRQLTSAQQSMFDQIHTYMRQSKAAAEAGDVGRAHTLAYKAHLLSDDLARK
jgi:outer membrane biosynthesis protein TonB